MNLILSDGMTTSRKGGAATMTSDWQETLVEKQVTYTLELNGNFFLIENVPARVNEETGEQFSPHQQWAFADHSGGEKSRPCD